MKEIVKNYVKNITPDMVKNFALKEGTNVTDEEAILFINIVNERIQDILNGQALEVLEENKNSMSEEAYKCLISLYNKYKKFID